MYSCVWLGVKNCWSSNGVFEKEEKKIDLPEDMKDGDQSDCCGCIRNF